MKTPAQPRFVVYKQERWLQCVNWWDYYLVVKGGIAPVLKEEWIARASYRTGHKLMIILRR